MRSGEVDLVPEYLGSALEVTFGVDPSNDFTESYGRLADAWLAEDFLVMFPAPAQSQNGFAMTEMRAGMLGVSLLSDIVTIAADLTFGGPPECPERPRCLLGLSDTYGIRFGAVTTLDAGGPATIQALHDGTIDVGLVFTTDPAVEDGDLLLLGDDLGLQPNESIVPILSLEAAERFGNELLILLDDISAALEQRAVVALNRAVAAGRSPDDAAEEWLLVNGFGP
jgi:osmoprotectant transport system substrate-binding protein